MTKREIENNGKKYFASKEFKEVRKINKVAEKVQVAFLKKFDRASLDNLSIDDYVVGKNNDSFCYLIEYPLEPMGMMRGYSRAQHKYGIYYSKVEGKYCYIENSKFGNNENEIFKNVKNEIISLIDAGKRDDFDAMEKNKLSPMFKGKVYYIYYSQKALPIYSDVHLDFFIETLGIQCDIGKIGNFRKRALIVDWKNSSQVFRGYTTLEFMDFLYSGYGFKRETDILKSGAKIIRANDINIISGRNIADRQVFRNIGSSCKRNYDELNKKKTSIGLIGEQIVLQYEKNKIKNKSKQIKMVSLRNDSLGYDILSFDENGNEIHIEVKTSTSGNLKKIDFFISSNEYEKLNSDPNYKIYYVFGIRKEKPTIIILDKNNFNNVTFNPVSYRVNAEIEI